MIDFVLDGVSSCVDRVMGHFYVDKHIFPEKSQKFSAVYSRDKEYL
jgi:anoctamin-1